MKKIEWKEAMKKASEDMCQALNAFGSQETLKLLLEFSKDDLIVNELLTMYPTIVSTGNFLFGKPTFQIDEKTFRTLMDANPDIWIKREESNPEEESDIYKKTPRRPKRTRNREQIPDQPKQVLPTKHRENISQELNGEDHEKITESLPGTMGEMPDDMKLDLAFTLVDRGEHEAALALFSSLPWDTYGEAKCCGMGRVLTEMGRYDEAKRVLEFGLKKLPKSYVLWTDLGILCDIMGNYSEALRCFEAALRFNYGEDSACLYNKALVLIKLRSYRDAVAIIDDLVERFPEDPKYFAERGCCSLEMGYPKEALQYFQRAMELYERFPSVDAGVSIYTGLCSSYLDLGMKKEAMEIALEGLTKFPDEDPILYHNVGVTFYEMGWIGEAKDVLQKGIQKFPDDAELKAFLKDVEDDFDNDPSDGGELLGLILLIAVIQKKLRKK